MTATARILQTVIANPSLPQLDYDSLSNVPEFETMAWEHWIFDTGDEMGLVGRVTSRILSPQDDDPTYDSNSLTIGGYGNALLTTLPGRADWSMALVIGDYDSSNSMVLGGTLGGTTGSGLISLDFTSPLAAWIRGISPVSQAATLVVPAAGSEAFVGITIDYTGSSTRRDIWALGQNRPLAGGTGTIAVSANTFALGNAYYNNATYLANGPKLHEAILFDRALSAAEMAGVYARSRVRMARRGISIV